MYFLLRFSSCMVDTALLVLLVKYVIDAGMSASKKEFGMAAFCAIVGAGVDTWLSGNPGTMTVIFLFPLVLYLRCGTGTVWKKLGRYALVFLLYLSLSLLSVFTEMLLFEAAFGASQTNTRYTLISIVLNLLAIAGLHLYCQKRKRQIRFSGKEWVLLFTVNTVTFLLLTALNRFGGLWQANTLSETVLLLVLNYSVLFFYVFFVLFLASGKATSYYREISRLSQRQMEDQLEHFRAYKQMQSEMQKFRHDMKHHLGYLQTLCGGGDTQAAQQYLSEINVQWEEIPRFYSTGDEVVDTVLNAKQHLLEEHTISLTLDGRFAVALWLRPIDSCTIFANALDNAIEANLQIPKAEARCIHVSIKSSENHHLVQMTNPLNVPLKMQGGEIMSSKSDPVHHGYGLANMARALEQNDGYRKITADDVNFTLEIVLPH